MTPALAEHLAALNPEQHAAVTHTGTPLLILAGAGSGKTRVITTKIAYLIDEKGSDPRSILAVTFTKKAANEMAERAHALAGDAQWCSIQTFHSFGARFLRRYARGAGIDPHFTVYDDDDAVTLTAKAVPALAKKQAAYFAHRIALAKDYCLSETDEDLPLIEPDPNFPAIYAAYQARLRDTGNVDFGDLIMLPALLLEGDPLVAAEAHRRWTTILVDEYQDSNIAQARLLKALAGPAAYVCVVGDDDQSIYHFRGAEVKNMLDFQKDFSATQVVRLERNYRSVAAILAVADTVVTRNVSRLGKTLRAERGDGKRPVLAFLPNQDDEAAFAASLVQRSLANGAHLSDWAILYRTNAQSLALRRNSFGAKSPTKS
jgi:DNA helicase-2/ATP-dependent DNA helicase PcrA